MAAASPLSSPSAYGQWSAPKEDGALLIWPEAPRLAAVAIENARRLATAQQVLLHGTPIPELRRAARTFLGHPDDRPLIITGHQAELHHPGVWIKDALICAVARACDGVAMHIAVDTDAPKHLRLRWPGFAEPISDDPRLHNAAWSGLLDPPTPAHLEALLDAAEAAAERGMVSQLVCGFLGNCRAFVIDQRDAIAPLELPAILANAQHSLDWELGLQYSALTLSGLLASEAWARFVCHIAADAAGFASAYNKALHDYRKQAGIDAADRPMPDLLLTQKRVELPFWLDDLAHGRRYRAEAAAGTDNSVSVGRPGANEPFIFSGSGNQADELLAWLRRHQLRLAPRALSLTMFLRLCVGDLFIHGIGGGHYDQVTDRLIRDYFQIDPPAFAVATATLYHPRALAWQRVDLPALRREGHRVAHGVLEQEKRRWLAQIQSSGDPSERRETFRRMHEARRASLEHDAAYADWRRRLAEAHGALEVEAELFDREQFYAVQPEDRLRYMIDRVNAAVGAGNDWR